MCHIISLCLSSRRRHTRLQGDWSSDVCSSDLRPVIRPNGTFLSNHCVFEAATDLQVPAGAGRSVNDGKTHQIGRASCREREESAGGTEEVKVESWDAREKEGEVIIDEAAQLRG